MKKIILGLLVLSLVGCGDQFMPKPKGDKESKPAAKKEEKKGGIINDVILQRSKLEANKSAQERINKINADREAQIKEASDF